MPALPKAEMHSRIVAALDGHQVSHGDLSDVPFLLDVEGLMPLAIWAFTLTNPPGGRHPAESKIQIMVPGQGRDDRADFEGPPGRYKVLVGVHPDDDVFVLWDAYKQRNFTFSKNVQVRGPIVWDAQLAGLASGERRLRDGLETVIAARADHLRTALSQRIAAE